MPLFKAVIPKSCQCCCIATTQSSSLKMIIFVDTEILSFLWLVTQFTSATMSGHFAVCIQKVALFFSDFFNFSSSCLH